MSTAIVGALLLVFGATAIALGFLPLPDAIVLFERTWPILLFVAAITVVSELAAEAGLFTSIASRVARWGRGRTVLLWLLVVALATLSTIVLSLDTTAVLLTPVVVVLARRSGLDPLPFAITTVWLANTASLLLPVSNLTNLLAQHEMGGITPFGFAALTAVPALVAVVVPALAVFAIFRRRLTGRYAVPTTDASRDRLLLVASGIVVAALVPALVSGVEVWIPAMVAAVVLSIVFLARGRRTVLSVNLVPWSLIILASGLFVSIEALHSLGMAGPLATIAGTGEDAVGLLRVAGAGLVSANLVDNLPAYLALEPVAGSPERLVALLIGVNAGPLITPWASLATLLWHDRLVGLGVRISWRRYALLGAVVAPLTVGLATLAFALTRGT